MKPIYLYLMAAASAYLMTGCADDALNGLDTGSRTITAVLVDDEESHTRTCVDVATYDNPEFVGILWTPGDSIGVYSSSTKNALFKNTSPGNARKTAGMPPTSQARYAISSRSQ